MNLGITLSLGSRSGGSGASQAPTVVYSNGVATATPARGGTLQWYRDGVAIVGATNAVYNIVSDDYGTWLTVKETANSVTIESLVTPIPTLETPAFFDLFSYANGTDMNGVNGFTGVAGRWIVNNGKVGPATAPSGTSLTHGFTVSTGAGKDYRLRIKTADIAGTNKTINFNYIDANNRLTFEFSSTTTWMSRRLQAGVATTLRSNTAAVSGFSGASTNWADAIVDISVYLNADGKTYYRLYINSSEQVDGAAYVSGKGYWINYTITIPGTHVISTTMGISSSSSATGYSTLDEIYLYPYINDLLVISSATGDDYLDNQTISITGIAASTTTTVQAGALDSVGNIVTNWTDIYGYDSSAKTFTKSQLTLPGSDAARSTRVYARDKNATYLNATTTVSTIPWPTPSDWSRTLGMVGAGQASYLKGLVHSNAARAQVWKSVSPVTALRTPNVDKYGNVVQMTASSPDLTAGVRIEIAQFQPTTHYFKVIWTGAATLAAAQAGVTACSGTTSGSVITVPGFSTTYTRGAATGLLYPTGGFPTRYLIWDYTASANPIMNLQILECTDVTGTTLVETGTYRQLFKTNLGTGKGPFRWLNMIDPMSFNSENGIYEFDVTDIVDDMNTRIGQEPTGAYLFLDTSVYFACETASSTKPLHFAQQLALNGMIPVTGTKGNSCTLTININDPAPASYATCTYNVGGAIDVVLNAKVGETWGGLATATGLTSTNSNIGMFKLQQSASYGASTANSTNAVTALAKTNLAGGLDPVNRMGASIKEMVVLGNETGRDTYCIFPVRATEAAVRAMAQKFLTTASSTAYLFAGVGNEVWNNANQYMPDQIACYALGYDNGVPKTGLPSADANLARYTGYSVAFKRIMGWLKSEFVAAGQFNRLVRVMECIQNNNTSTAATLIDRTGLYACADCADQWFTAPYTSIVKKTNFGSFTASTTNASTALTNMTAGAVAGHLISGTGIQAGTTLISVNHTAQTAVMSLTATATSSGTVTVTQPSVSFTATTTSGSPNLTSVVPVTSGPLVGEYITAVSIPTGSTSSVPAGTTISSTGIGTAVMSANATSSGSFTMTHHAIPNSGYCGPYRSGARYNLADTFYDPTASQIYWVKATSFVASGTVATDLSNGNIILYDASLPEIQSWLQAQLASSLSGNVTAQAAIDALGTNGLNDRGLRVEYGTYEAGLGGQVNTDGFDNSILGDAELQVWNASIVKLLRDPWYETFMGDYHYEMVRRLSRLGTRCHDQYIGPRGINAATQGLWPLGDYIGQPDAEQPGMIAWRNIQAGNFPIYTNVGDELRVTGLVKVGQRLDAMLNPRGARSATYSWLADAVSVGTTQSITVPGGTAGQTLIVTVTATNSAYTTPYTLNLGVIAA